MNGEGKIDLRDTKGEKDKRMSQVKNWNLSFLWGGKANFLMFINVIITSNVEKVHGKIHNCTLRFWVFLHQHHHQKSQFISFS